MTGDARSLPLRWDSTDAGVPPVAMDGSPTALRDLAGEAIDFAPRFLGLAQVRGVGFQALRVLVSNYDDLGRVWDDPKGAGQVLTDRRIPGGRRLVDALQVEGPQLLAKGRRVRDELFGRGITLLGRADPFFPARLRDLPGGPLWLFIDGNAAALHGPPLVAIVGTREATQVGLRAAQQLARIVAEAGLTIVSGLAEGVDQAAQLVAARLGVPQVAVLGTGIDVVFPASSDWLRRAIVDQDGAVVTEYLPGERWGRANFVQRNRIQAGLAAAVCPVEGRAQGGTAHTAHFAQEYGRPIFGVLRGEPPPENDLVRILLSQGRLVFDLAQPGDRKGLRAFLDGIEPDRGRGSPPAPPEPRLLFRPILAEVDELRSFWDLRRQDREDLVEQVARRLGVRDETGEASDGG